MKVGTDGVLLGAWAQAAPTDRRILDIGTGTGLIALMMAQRAPEALVTGVDIGSVEEARANAEASPWASRLCFYCAPIQEFRPEAGERYDLILSNPPFFVDSLTCPDEGRTRVRHAVTLPFDELRDAVVRLLAPGGRFALILPVEESLRFETLCRGVLSPMRRTGVRTTPRRPVRRVLTEYLRAEEAQGRPCADDSLVIGTGEHECYTEEYRALTRDFYLKF